jgi:acyl-CoA dehydrogenase family protein 9
MTSHLADPEHHPSFIRGIFLGELREDLVFPFPELSADDKESLAAILGSWRAWAADTVDSARQDREGRFGEGVREGMASLGMMGINIPQEYGGFGASALLFSRVFAEVGVADPALAVYFGAHQSIGCKGITLFGTEDQKRRWLPQCASGERVAAFCLTEAGSGSDAQALRTTAVPSADGTHYVLDGEKIWISNAGFAGVFTVFAKVPVEVEGKARQRTTAFIVDARAPGITLGKPEEKMGIKASDTRTVSFRGVKVPVEDRLGEVGAGFRIALEILNSGRLGLAAGSSRGTRRVLDLALAYAKERRQFGRPIGSFEMIQRKFAIAAAECYAADAGWMTCAAMVDRGGIDFSLETAACKVFASELALRAALDAQQVAGGMGFSKEFPFEQAVRDSRIMLIFEGTNEILRALIALSGLQQPGEQLKELGRAFRDPLRSLGAIGSYLGDRVKRGLGPCSLTLVHPALQEEAGLVCRTVRDLAGAVEKLLVAHGRDLIERQFHQERLANAAIDIYLSTATLSRATWAIGRAGSPDGAAADLDNARIFVSLAMRRARRALRALEHNQDARLKALAERALESGSLTVETPTDA